MSQDFRKHFSDGWMKAKSTYLKRFIHSGGKWSVANAFTLVNQPLLCTFLLLMDECSVPLPTHALHSIVFCGWLPLWPPPRIRYGLSGVFSLLFFCPFSISMFSMRFYCDARVIEIIEGSTRPMHSAIDSNPRCGSFWCVRMWWWVKYILRFYSDLIFCTCSVFFRCSARRTKCSLH